MTALSLGAAALLAAATARAAAWQLDVDYGGTLTMDLYVPDAPVSKPPVVVLLHYCGGNASDTHAWMLDDANMHGFVMVAPSSNGSCFDASAARAGDRGDVVAMVSYALNAASGDPKRVFAVGLSTGACMVQALLASYPDVFAAGSSLAGCPAGSWTGGASYGVTVPGSRSAQQWGDLVRNADPGYSGAMPRIQLWHGKNDTVFSYTTVFSASVAQWTNVFGLAVDSGAEETLQPPGAAHSWNRTTYKDGSDQVVVEANGNDSATNDLRTETLFGDVVRFFELDKAVEPGTGGTGGMGGTGGTSTAGTGGTTSGGDAGADTGSGGTNGGTTGNGGTGNGGTSTGNGGTQPSGGGTGNGGTSAASGQTGRGGTSSAGTAGTDSAQAGESNAQAGSDGVPATGGSSAGPGAGGSGANAPGSGGTAGGGNASGNGEDLRIERYHACLCELPDGGSESSLWAGAGLVGLVALLKRRRRGRPAQRTRSARPPH